MITSRTPARIFLHPMQNLARISGLFVLLILLNGCQTGPAPEKVTQAFWEAMAQGDLDTARKYATRTTQYLVARQQNVEGASLRTGTVTIDGENARVATILTLKKPENKVLTFDTVLAEEDAQWKVDYLQTLNNFLHLPFGEIFRSLQGIGEAFTRELEKQIPLYQKQLESFSEELLRQLEEFRRQMEKSIPPEKQRPLPGTI